jgi:hypothetical protein
MRLVILLVCCAAFPKLASAQVAFPPDPAWTALRCGAQPMSDRLADQPGAIDDRDIVGDAAAPAGLRASDATNLYLRMRLDKDPAPGGAIRGFAWGMQFDLDGDLSTYELMVIVDGTAGPAAASVALLRNTATTSGNVPSDPADAPAVATYPLAMNARSIPAPGSSFGGTGDFFLDFAVPWSALVPLGLGRTTPTHVWAGTSTVANALDGDLACHDGATGAARLDATASDRTTGDPAQDPAGGPGGTGQLEGGGGCAAGGAGAPSSALALALVLLARRRRR